MAHEINNPLQSIIGCLGLAEEILPEGSEAGRYLEVARVALQRVAQTVAQLHDLHRTTESEQLETNDLNQRLAKGITLVESKCGLTRIISTQPSFIKNAIRPEGSISSW